MHKQVPYLGTTHDLEVKPIMNQTQQTKKKTQHQSPHSKQTKPKANKTQTRTNIGHTMQK